MFSQTRLPQSRLSRLAKLGQLAGGIASGALSEGARLLSQGQMPSMRSVLLTANNTTRLTDRLSEMRGAAMKMGQQIYEKEQAAAASSADAGASESSDDEEVVDAEFSEVDEDNKG